MTRRTPSAKPFEPAFLEGLVDIFENQMVFDRVIGLRVVSIAAERVAGRIDMRPDLIGHFAFRRLHGGVIST